MTSLFEDILISKGWRSFEAKRKKDRKRSCWVSPDGKWYNVAFSDHQLFAFHVFRDLYPKEKSGLNCVDFDNAGDVLKKKGWICIQHTWAFGTIVQGWKNMTLKQYKVLYAYFKNEKLFRGWTIPLLYREKKGA